MSPFARRIPVAAMLVGLAAVGAVGCADSESVIFIRQVNVPSTGGSTTGGCTVEANPEGPFISHGALDVAFRSEYTASLVVGSQIVTTGSRTQIRTETSRVRIEGVEVRVEDALGALAWGPHTIPATGFIDPSIGTEPSYGIVDATLIGADFGLTVAGVLQNYPGSVRHFTSISKVFGHTLGQTAVQSGEFHFPITMCYGCLIFFPADANDPKILVPSPNCDMPTTTGSVSSMGCTPGQDQSIDCRACKAQYPNNSICEPPP